MADDDNSKVENVMGGVPDKLYRLFDLVKGVVDGVREDQDGRMELDAQSNNAARFAEGDPDGITIPVRLNRDGVPKDLHPVMNGLLIEQSRASVYFAQLSPTHPYLVMFQKLAHVWHESAISGAMTIAKKVGNTHDCDDPTCEANGTGEVGPRELNAAWMSITTAAVIGAVRYGQEHPEALKGMEGVSENDIDQSIQDLLAFVAQGIDDEENKEE